MKRIFVRKTMGAVWLALLMMCACSGGSNYDELLAYAEGIKVINTHEHQRWCEDNAEMDMKLSHLIQSAYLQSDVASAGGRYFSKEEMDNMSMEQYWEINGEALDRCRSTTYYGHFLAGIQQLYDFPYPYFTKENIVSLSKTIQENYADYSSWFDKAFHKAGFELMFLDQYWNTLNTKVDQKHYALVFNINQLVYPPPARTGTDANLPPVYQLAKEEGIEIRSLNDYLSFCDHLLEVNIGSGAVCLKNSMAYGRSIYYEKVSREEAEALFEKPVGTLGQEEIKRFQDFIFHWIIGKSIDYALPIQIHTGYLAGNGNTLDNGHPAKLNELFLEYPEAHFVLFHGGFPWTGEYGAFGKMFSNVYLDLVWLPQISRERAVQALDEMLDLVPYNKFFWGGDCQFIEESTGALAFGRSVVAEVLDKRISRGQLDQELAREIMDAIFRENAIRFFELEKRLGEG